MRIIAGLKNRLYYIGVILLLFILISTIAPYILRGMFPTPYFEIVKRYAAENKLETTMVYAVIKAESGFKDDAVSHKGAIGLMQITEKTGHWIASKLGMSGFTAKNLMEPDTNIRFGCWYLSYLIERFNGNTELALAAYNAGEGTVTEWLEQGNVKWKDLSISSLPYNETQKYLIRVNRMYYVYKTLYPEMKQ
jgi:soluble lytic murein transglycosylase